MKQKTIFTILILIILALFAYSFVSLRGSTNFACNEQHTLARIKQCTVLIKRSDGGHGTGFSIKPGYVVTAKHVIEGAKDIYIDYYGESKATLWNYSKNTDIAVIKTDKKIPTCKWSTSSDVELAETLYAVGWPDIPEGDSSITRGVYYRSIQTNDGENYIQTDAAINPGNSGGPLADKCGIIGVNAFKILSQDLSAPYEGYGFAISSNYASGLVDKLITTGEGISDATSLLLEKVSLLIDIPKELPTLATVTDISKLSNQKFFTNAQNGDRVLIFKNANKAIIYRPSTNEIINVDSITE